MATERRLVDGKVIEVEVKYAIAALQEDILRKVKHFGQTRYANVYWTAGRAWVRYGDEKARRKYWSGRESEAFLYSSYADAKTAVRRMQNNRPLDERSHKCYIVIFDTE